MSDFVLAGVGVALLTLIFSSFPFIQLVYVIAIQTVVDWTQWGIVTGLMLISLLGANIFKRTSK